MSMDAKELLAEALRLPPKARAALASQILESLDEDDADPDVRAAWAEEIDRRVDDGDDAYDDVTVDELEQELRAVVKKTREAANPSRRAR